MHSISTPAWQSCRLPPVNQCRRTGAPPPGLLRQWASPRPPAPPVHGHRPPGPGPPHTPCTGDGAHPPANGGEPPPTGPHFLGNTDGGQGKRLIRSLGLHLKGLRAPRSSPRYASTASKIRSRFFSQGRQRQRETTPKNKMAGLPSPLQVAIQGLGLHIDGGLNDIHVKFPVGLHPAAHILPELAFKLLAVLSLQDNLPQLQQKISFMRRFLRCDSYASYCTTFPGNCLVFLKKRHGLVRTLLWITQRITPAILHCAVISLAYGDTNSPHTNQTSNCLR